MTRAGRLYEPLPVVRREAYGSPMRGGFDPAGKVKRQQEKRYWGANLLSREETLLSAMQQDPSELDKQDYAFTLARLRLGATLRNLQLLKWEQTEHNPVGDWVWRRPGVERQPLPREM